MKNAKPEVGGAAFGELSDYLKSNCRSWETDCDDEESTNMLASHIASKFPRVPAEDAFAIAARWTGYAGDADQDE